MVKATTPKLYVYDHCPYCVKARMIFGYKNIPFELITLANDDEETPVNLIGQKMVPILDMEGAPPLPESLDIITKIDQLDGSPLVDSKTKASKKLERWLSEAKKYTYPLAMPRWIKMPLGEFQTESAVAYFTRKKEDYIGPFKEHFANSEDLIAQANKHLLELEETIPAECYFHGEKLHLDDFHLYAALRSLSCVKGITFPEKVFHYMHCQEKASKVPLHLDLAL